VIDVAGTTTEQVSVARQFVTTEPLGSNDLKDSPLQKLGPLYRSRVTFDLRAAVPILGDTSSYKQAIEKTVAKRLSAGGQVMLESRGAVVTHTGSNINVSGGQVTYTAATVAPTVLQSDTGASYTLNTAPADQVYTRIEGVDAYYTARDATGASLPLQDRWGALTRYSAALAGHNEPGYVEGRVGGKLSISAAQAVLGGGLQAATVVGERQRDGRDALAAASSFSLGSTNNGGAFGSTSFNGTGLETALQVVTQVAPLGDGFWATPGSSAALPADSQVSANTLSAAGFGSVVLASEGRS
jgi:hypothetical protein